MKNIEFNKNEVESVLKLLIHGVGDSSDDEIVIHWQDLALMLVLWRYPLPSRVKLAEYQVKFTVEDFRPAEKKQEAFFGMGTTAQSLAEENEGFTFEKFLKIPCWLDEWDESLCKIFLSEKFRHEFERGRCL